MKKIFITVAALFCVATFVNAQTLVVVEEKPVITGKHGKRILPQAGDFALGVSVNPLFSYMKYMFRSDGPQSITFDGVNAPMIYGKYFVHDNQAFRFGVSLSFGNQYYHGTVIANGNADATVKDLKKDAAQAFGARVGYEWRRGHGRVQGFYGLEGGVSYSKVKSTYTYGNEMTTTYTNPYTWDFDLNSARPMTNRVLEDKGAATLQIGVYGFVGVEYFFAPKMSIGGEFNLGVVWNHNGESEVKTQYWSAADSSVETETVKQRNYNNPEDGLSIRTKATGNIALMFYF